MPSSTARGFPYPLSTDPLSQGAVAIQNLASYLDSYVPKYGDAPDPNMAKVYRSLTTSIPNGGTATMTWDQVVWNPTGMYAGANPTRLTVPAGAAGKYLLVCSVGFSVNATGYRAVVLLLNGTTALGRSTQQAANGATHVAGLAAETQLAVGDYVEVTGGQNSGAALNTTGGVDMTWLSARRIGP